MVDNFEQIKKLITFNEKDDLFFLLQIFRRKKDHKEEKSKKLIKSYFIKSREHLDKIKDEVISLCNLFEARAYINISEKSFKRLQNYLLYKLAEYNENDIVSTNPTSLVVSAASKIKSKKPKWIVDIDDLSMLQEVRNEIPEENIITEIPTKNGIHVITTPFNLKIFHIVFPDINVHKDSNGTILYIPDI